MPRIARHWSRKTCSVFGRFGFIIMIAFLIYIYLFSSNLLHNKVLNPQIVDPNSFLNQPNTKLDQVIYQNNFVNESPEIPQEELHKSLDKSDDHTHSIEFERLVEVNKIAKPTSDNQCTTYLQHKDSTPVIIFGIGDSGTSAIRKIFGSVFNTKFCKWTGGSIDDIFVLRADHIHLQSIVKASQSFIHHFPEKLGKYYDDVYQTMCNGAISTLDCANGCSPIQNQGAFQRYKGLKVENRPAYPPQNCSHDGNVFDYPKFKFWGWKSPRSLYYLHFYHKILGGNAKFIHVVRDGRDVASGDNQMQFWMLCQFSWKGCNDKSTGDSFKFWSAVNAEIFKFALENLPYQYYTLRIEDFVIGDIDYEVKQLLDFLDLPSSSNIVNQKANQIRSSTRPASSSYGGAKYSMSKKKAILNEVSKSSQQILEFLGYKTNSWGLERHSPQTFLIAQEGKQVVTETVNFLEKEWNGLMH